MNIGYARVSTTDQNCENQIKMLENYPCQAIYHENLSGKTTDRPQLKKLFQDAKAGDVLVVYKLDRLSRSLMDTIDLLTQLEARKVGFKSLTEPFDTTLASGRMMMQMLAVFAEWERTMIQERVKSGVKNAQAKGIKFGRKEKLNNTQKQTILNTINKPYSQQHFADQFGVTQPTISRFLKKHVDVMYKSA